MRGLDGSFRGSPRQIQRSAAEFAADRAMDLRSETCPATEGLYPISGFWSGNF